MKRFFLLLIIPFLALSCAKEAEMSINYEKYTLDNGLEVVLHQDTSDPIVSVAIQYHVGSAREKVGKTGFAHFFEHMLFQRSENLPRNAFFQKISSMGGDFNGGTSQDGTVYFESVPRDALEKVLWMESDRMGFFINTVTQAGLEREIDVILNEKRQTTDNRAYGQLGAIIADELYPQGHPYSWTVIGKMDDIRSATIEDVKEFYSTYYVPSNATLVIAGDFDPTNAKELVNKYFAEIANNNIDKPKVQNITLSESKRVMYEDLFGPLPYLTLAFPAVQNYNPDEAPLDIMCELIGGSKKSPLYKAIVEANLAPNASIYNGAYESAGAVRIGVQAYSGISLDTVYAAIQKAFAEFEKNGVDLEELETIKATKESQFYSQLSSVMYKAMILANSNEYGGTPDRFISVINDLKKVTAADVMRVYNKYIKGQNNLAVSMVPKGETNLALANSRVAVVDVENVEDASSKENRSKAGAIVDDNDYPRTTSTFDRSIEPPYMANSPSVSQPQIWNKELSNGIKLYGITQKEIPMVNFQINIDAGLFADPEGKPGVSNLVAALMNQGTSLRSAEVVEQDLKKLGASVRASSSSKSLNISGSVLSRNFGKTIAIIEEMILNPLYDQSILDREKNKVIAQMQQIDKNPNYLAVIAFDKLLLGEKSLWAQMSIGTKESVPMITMDDIKASREKLSPRNATLMIAGDIDMLACEKELSSLITKWQGEKVEVNIPEVTPQNDNIGKVFFKDFPGSKQSVIEIGRFAKSLKDPLYPALDVLNYKLGSGSNGELFNVLRLQRGYTYGAYSGFQFENEYGYFGASSSVQANVTKESLDIFKDIFANFGQNFTQEKLDATKDALIRQNAFAFETNYNLLSVLNSVAIDGLPMDYVQRNEKVVKDATLEQIKALADEYLNINNMIYVVVGDAKTQLKNVKGAIVIQ